MSCNGPGKDPRTGFTMMSPGDMDESLYADGAALADELRDLEVQAGQRPYQLSVVRVRWTGVKRGLGEPIVVSTTPILPTPKVADLDGLAREMTPGGVDEVGSLFVSNVSRRFGEEYLSGLDAAGNPQEPAEQLFFELLMASHGAAPRSFILASAPAYVASKFGWQLVLERAKSRDLKRSGTVR